MQEQRVSINVQTSQGPLKFDFKDNVLRIQFLEALTQTSYEANYTNDNLPQVVIMFFENAENFYKALKDLTKQAFKFNDSKLIIAIVIVNLHRKIQLPLQKNQLSKQQVQQRKISQLERQLQQEKQKNTRLLLQIQNLKEVIRQKQQTQKQNLNTVDYLKQEIQMIQTQFSTLEYSSRVKQQIKIQNCEQFRQQFKVQKQFLNKANYLINQGKITKIQQNGIYSQVYGEKIAKNSDFRITLNISKLTNKGFNVGIQVKNNLNLKQLKDSNGVLGYFGYTNKINCNGIMSDCQCLQQVKQGDLVKMQILIKFKLFTLQLNGNIIMTAQIPESMIEAGIHPFLQLASVNDSIVLIQ